MPHPHPIVSKIELYQTADRQFGSSEYGFTANTLLHYKTQLLGRGHIRTQQGDVFLDLVDRVENYQLASATPEQAEINMMIRRLQPLTPFNHTMVPVSKNDPFRANAESGIRLFDIEQGEIARVGLAVFLNAKRYAEHTLHGSLGKAIDTLCLASGVVSPDTLVSRDYDDEFISRRDLTRGLDQSSLSKRSQQTVLEHIRDDARIQLRDMEPGPTPDGELVFEGAVTVGKSTSFTFDTIARSSLGIVLPRRLADSSPAGEYLQQTYGQ